MNVLILITSNFNKSGVSCMSKVKVSVIVPVYNCENYIEDCMNSLVNQTLQEIEIIVINDGSTDSSARIIEQYRLQYSNKIIFIDAENRGPGLARNQGLNIAKGDYIGFVDGDDWVAEDMYQILYDEAEKGYDVVICTNRRQAHVDSVSFNTISPYPGKMPLVKEDFIKMIFYNASPWNKLFSAQLLHSVGFQYPDIWYEDIGYVPAVITYANSIKHINNVLYFWRKNENSITGLQNENLRTLDKVKAFDYALEKCHPGYKELLKYAVVERTLYDLNVNWLSNFKWMFYRYMQTLFPLSDSILHKYGLLNNEKYSNFITQNLIPPILHVMDIGKKVATKEKYDKRLNELGCNGFDVYIWTEDNFEFSSIDSLVTAFEDENYSVVNDYAKLVVLYKYGGICIDPEMEINIGFANILWFNTMLGTMGGGCIHTHVMASKPYSRMFIDLIETYQFKTYKNETHPLGERIVDYIFAVTGLSVLGTNQTISYLSLTIKPSTVLLSRIYPAINYFNVYETHELSEVYRLAAIKELLDNNNRYTALARKLLETETDLNNILKSTSWRIMKPLRKAVDIIRRLLKRG